MSANNQIVIAPYPENLDKYAVWHDGCVDNPFDFSQTPVHVCDTLGQAEERADMLADDIMIVEYGISVIRREAVAGYEMKIWDEYPDYKYLDVVRYTGPARRTVGDLIKDLVVAANGNVDLLVLTQDGRSVSGAEYRVQNPKPGNGIGTWVQLQVD